MSRASGTGDKDQRRVCPQDLDARLRIHRLQRTQRPKRLQARDVEGAAFSYPLPEISGPARQVGSSNASKDLAKAKRLWDLSSEMTGGNHGI